MNVKCKSKHVIKILCSQTRKKVIRSKYKSRRYADCSRVDMLSHCIVPWRGRVVGPRHRLVHEGDNERVYFCNSIKGSLPAVRFPPSNVGIASMLSTK